MYWAQSSTDPAVEFANFHGDIFHSHVMSLEVELAQRCLSSLFHAVLTTQTQKAYTPKHS